MRTTRFWAATTAAAAAVVIAATTFTGASADTTTPTAAEAQAALNHINEDQAIIQAYLDSLLLPPTTPPATTTVPPTTVPATTAPPTTTVAPTTVPPTTVPATTTAPPTTAPPTTTVAPDLFPANFTATAGDQKIVLAWAKPSGGTPTGYIYGRNGVDSTGYGSYTSPVQPATTLTMTLDKLINGTSYAVFVEAVYPTGGNKRLTLNRVPAVVATTPPATTVPATTTVAPTTTVPATTTVAPTTTTAPGARVSGLPWSSGVWANQDATQNQRFVTNVRGGRALDNILIYTSRESQAAQNNPSGWWASLPTNFDQDKQDLVLGLTTWTGDGASMTGAQAQAIGTSLCGLDSTPIVRLDWEMNLADGAGDNGAALTAANYTSWVARFRAAAIGLKATCPAVRIDFNPNHGTDQTAGCNSGTYAAPNNCSRQAFQAVKDLVHIFGIDRYDAWPPVTASGSGWSAHLSPFNELDESRTYALANGKKWSLPEWGVWVVSGNGGGDDPEYIKRYIAYFAAHSGDVAYETYFNYPDTWIISDLIDNNPNSRAQYRASVLPF